jgi:hypothetical protein
VERVEADVIVVSIDRLTTTVRDAAEILDRAVYRQTDGRSRYRRSHSAAWSG